MRTLVLALLASLSLAGCYTTRLYHTADVDTFKERMLPGRTHYVTSGVWAWGLFTPTRVNLSGYCQDTGIRNVRTQVSAAGALLGVITLGIYSQTSTMVVCAPKERDKEAAAERREGRRARRSE